MGLAFVVGASAARLAAQGPVAPEPPRVDLPYQAEARDPITHEVDFSAVVTPPYGCKVLKVWLPLPQSDAGQQIDASRLSTFPDQVEPVIGVEPVFGNKFAYFEFREPVGAQVVRHRFTAKVWELRWDLDAGRVGDVAQWPEAFQPYLKPQEIVAKGEFDRVLSGIVPRRDGAANDLRKVIEWIAANLTYDHAHASLRADANHAFQWRRGHCSDYHGLCATMGQTLGYPARVTYGLSLVPKNSPSHCKLEAFFPSYGWVSFDLSETQKMIQGIYDDSNLSADRKETLARAARERLHRGFRENSWLLLTKGTDYELAPKASRPVRVVRTIYAEADGEALPEPDPANPGKREFAWMTIHQYAHDKPFKLPFKDPTTLEEDVR